jgi:uncharacterized membrane protein YbhN (UPF0104 family)
LTLFVPRAHRASLSVALDAFAPRLRDVAGAFIFSSATSLALVIDYAIASQIVGERASLATVCVVAPLVVIASVLPIAPNGLGVAEAASAFLFDQFGIGTGASIILLNRVWMMIACLPGVVLFVFKSASLREQTTAPKTDS